jgi:hypothetical protein
LFSAPKQNQLQKNSQTVKKTKMNLIAQWNDENVSRNVHFSIDYSVKNSVLSIDAIKPTKVCILDESNETVVKTIGVHTAKARKMLTDQLKSSGQLEEFSCEISRRCGLLAESTS